MTTSHFLWAKDIHKALGQGASRNDVLRGVDLAVDQGQLTLLMGPSGSGKSTLLSVIGLMQRADSGDVFVDSLATGSLGPREVAAVRRRHIGYVFQSFNLFPGLSVRQNVELGLAVRGESGADSRCAAEAALASVGLQHKTSARPNMLSGGEQQRVAIARAIVGETSIILADEPTAALDRDNGHHVFSLLRTLAHDSRRAVVVVTHDARAAAYADRILQMVDGRIVPDAAGDSGMTCSFSSNEGTRHVG
ncbi:MAG: ABC transporter ATP-binding protein [Hyphomicrobiaceae bacterium]